MQTLAKCFYLRLAASNLKRNRRLYVPYLIASVIMSAMYFIITNLVASKSIANLSNGMTTQTLLAVGLAVMSLFTVGYMLYINSFLIKRRKKEFGLYGVLGLEKRHVGRVIFWENLMLSATSLVLGIATGCVFGRLIFRLLMLVLDTAQGSAYALAPQAFFSTAGMFAILFLLTTLYNLFQVRLSSPINLLKGEKRGEKKLRGVLPLSILGLLLLGLAYGASIVVADPVFVFLLFWPAVILVILATWLLFTAGSAVILRGLQKKKRFYYQPQNFIAVSGLLHRMRQNAAGLANICILSTMVMFTVAACTSLFLGQEDILKRQNPDDFVLRYEAEQSDEMMQRVADALPALAEQNHVKITEEKRYHAISFHRLVNFDGVNEALGVRIVPLADLNRLEGTNRTLNDGEVLLVAEFSGENLSYLETQLLQEVSIQAVLPGTALTNGKNGQDSDAVYLIVKDEAAGIALAQDVFSVEGNYGSVMCLNTEAANEDGLAFSDALDQKMIQEVKNVQTDGIVTSFSSIYCSRIEGYALYGGLVFLGAFFAILFLTNTVLIIYFKQISEGMEDCERFAILQKVGMDDREVRATINRQILIVFFLPLGMALLHMLAVTPMVIHMLQAFMLTNTGVTLVCLGITCTVFAAVYAVVYRITAKTYYNIVKK